MPNTDVLIVGAGPTGLVLAIALARRGISFRLIDQNKGPATQSRAMAVHARTLEFYQQFGFAQDVVDQGIVSEAINLWARHGSRHSKKVLRVTFDDLGKGLSPFPFVLTYPQDVHEKFLHWKLAELGVTVEWDTRLIDLEQKADVVDATIEDGAGRTTSLTASYVCGCDGAHSAVRKICHIGFSGGTYEQPFYVADVQLDGGYDDELHMNLGENILALMMPVRISGMQRLIGLVPPEKADKEDLTFEDLRSDVEQLVNIRVGHVNWFSRYKVHHRVAERFQDGRCFLLGDAGHVHSPVGGQGMNTGIGDAINLGWKLADVLRNRATASLLETYEPERIAFARTLVATTDSVFTPMIASGVKGEIIRRVIAPLVGMVASSFDVTKKLTFETVSQTKIEYNESGLSEGRAGKLDGGDRLPWVSLGVTDNFEALKSADWQIHVYGNASQDIHATAEHLGVPLHVFPWSDQAGHTGLAKDAIYVVRPDGYVGLADTKGEGQALIGYFDRIGVTFSHSGVAP